MDRAKLWIRHIGDCLLRRGVAVKLIVIFMLLVIIPTGGLGFLLIRRSQNTVRISVLRDYQEIAVRTAGEIEWFVKSSIKTLSATGDVISVIYNDPWKQQRILMKLGLEYPVFQHIYFADREGVERAASDLRTTPADRSEEIAFQKALEGKYFVSELFLSDQKIPHADISVPVKRRGKIVGALVARVNLLGIWDMVDTIKIGESGQVYVVAQRGTAIAHPDKKVIVQGLDLRDRKMVRAALSGRTGSGEYIDPEGEKWLGAYAPIPDLGWGLVIQQRMDEAYSFARAMKTQSAIILLGGLLVALALGVAVARSIIGPIKKLVEGTHKIAEGDLGYKIELAGKDEMGQLALSFNKMTFSLRQSQEELKASKDFSEGIVENAPIGIFTIDGDRCVTSANATLLKILGLDNSTDVVGVNASDIPFFKQIKLLNFLENKSSEAVLETGWEALNSPGWGGNRRMINAKKVPLDGSNCGSFLILMEDITEQKSMEQQLIQSEKLAGVGQLAAGIAHELRNPLVAINTSLHLLNRVLQKKDKDVSLSLSTIKEGVDRSQRIISNLLDFSRPSRYKREWVDIVSVLEQVLLFENKKITRQKIEVVRELEDIPKIRINLDSVRQAFLNLVTNATEAMPEGGTLRLRTSMSDNQKVLVEISDTGKGISKANLPRIFDPFFTTKEPGRGIGLGLSLTYKEIEKAGGKIGLKSWEGRGTKFTVELPI